MTNVNTALPISYGSTTPHDLTVVHDSGDFYVQFPHSCDRQLIQRGDISRELRGISSATLEKVLKGARLLLQKRSGENYSLRLQGRLRGGASSLDCDGVLILSVPTLFLLGGIALLGASSTCSFPEGCRVAGGVLMALSAGVCCLFFFGMKPKDAGMAAGLVGVAVI